MTIPKPYNSITKTLSTLLLIIFLITPTLAIQAAQTEQTPEAATPTGIPLSQVGNRIDELVSSYMHEFTPGFAVAIVKDGEIVFSRGYGYTDMERSTPVNPSSTVFEYGSISKLFVYTSVMQLVEQGLLDLDVYVKEYLPEDLYRELNFQKPFTMRDLLNHSAGFGEFFFNLFPDPENLETEISLREGLLISRPDQLFEPGTASSYSNFGNALAAYIVAGISGREFTDYERINILGPIGMTNTKNQGDWLGDDEFIQMKARGHVPNGRGGFNETAWAYIPIYPAGALRGTAEDLARFAIALMPPQGEASPLFDSRDTLDLMLSPSFSNPDIMRGTHHGFMSYDGIYPALGHGGSTRGFNSDFAIVPSQRFGVVLLTNADGGAGFIEKVMDLLIGNSRDTVPIPTGNLPDAQVFAGDYMMLRRHEGNLMEFANFLISAIRVDAVDENTINVNAMGMTLTYRQTEPYVFRLISSDSFLARSGYELRFRMENGRPIGISLSAPFDATIATFGQSVAVLLVSVAAGAISIIFFLAMPIIILIKFLRKKEEPSVFNRLSNALLLSGTMIVLNNIVLMIRALSDILNTQTSMVTFHVWINYVLLALAVILLIASVVFLIRDKINVKLIRSRKVIYFSTIFFMAIFLVVLWNWNFFVVM